LLGTPIAKEKKNNRSGVYSSVAKPLTPGM